jgi:microcompartment protein CcmL/EutN
MPQESNSLSEDDKSQKIQSLREVITTAETTIKSAKAMLLQFEGKKKAGRKKKIDGEDEGQVVQGVFDGQIMVGHDGKNYPIPANYASKSKLVEGDLLKLTISPEGFFIYKQIGPVPRQNKIGIVAQDPAGNYFVQAEESSYRILLASATYFKAEPGDEVVIVTGSDDECQWASIESVLQHNHLSAVEAHKGINLPNIQENALTTVTGMLTGKENVTSEFADLADSSDPIERNDKSQSIIDEWTPDIDEIEKEIQAEMNSTQS